MARIVVVGSSNTDMTVRLPSLPAPGQTLLGGAFATSPGGKGANQAVAARRAGAEVVFIAAIGDDPLGRQSLDLYRREGIDVSRVRIVPGMSSGVALIFVGEDGENMIGVAPGANGRLTPVDIDLILGPIGHEIDVLLVGLEVPLETARRAMAVGGCPGKRVILNPAPAPAISSEEARALIALADVITPNRGEALLLAGMSEGTTTNLGTCAGRLLEMGAKAVVITLGSEGCLVASGSILHRVYSPRVEAVDTVGAGDAFNGALAVALAEDRSLLEGASWACAAAALAVTRPGAQAALPTRAEIDRLAASSAPPSPL